MHLDTLPQRYVAKFQGSVKKIENNFRKTNHRIGTDEELESPFYNEECDVSENGRKCDRIVDHNSLTKLEKERCSFKSRYNKYYQSKKKITSSAMNFAV